jgi:hypothetical protein
MLDPCQEAGWVCMDCQEKLGCRPDLDREQTWAKVWSILQDLHHAQFVYVSNAAEGEMVVAAVARQCHDRDTYDQYSIMRWILEHPEIEHADFWQRQAHAWLNERTQQEEEHAGG